MATIIAGVRGAQTAKDLVPDHDGGGSAAARLSLCRREGEDAGRQEDSKDFQQRTQELPSSTNSGT